MKEKMKEDKTKDIINKTKDISNKAGITHFKDVPKPKDVPQPKDFK